MCCYILTLQRCDSQIYCTGKVKNLSDIIGVRITDRMPDHIVSLIFPLYKLKQYGKNIISNNIKHIIYEKIMYTICPTVCIIGY